MIGNGKVRDKVRAGPFNNKGRGVLAVGQMGMAVQISFQSGGLCLSEQGLYQTILSGAASIGVACCVNPGAGCSGQAAGLRSKTLSAVWCADRQEFLKAESSALRPLSKHRASGFKLRQD